MCRRIRDTVFTDTTQYPINGKYKDLPLYMLPANFLLGIYRNYNTDKRLKQYIADNLEKIHARALDEGILPERSKLPVCTKKQYATKREANDHLKWIRNVAAKRFDHKIPIRSYECDICSAWHLTSKPHEKFKEVKEIPDEVETINTNPNEEMDYLELWKQKFINLKS